MPYEEELVTNKIGRRYWIDKHDTFYQQRIKGVGPYQKKNLLRLRELVPACRTAIDVGMNIGMNSIEYATWAKEVHGFEPTPTTYSMAIRNIALAQEQTNDEMVAPWYKEGSVDFEGKVGASLEVTGDIHTYQMGLGDEEGEFDICIQERNAHINRLDNFHIPTPSGRARRKRTVRHRERVQVKTLDSFNFENVDIVKVDTEGFEMQVVLGGEKTILEQLPIVQLEIMDGQPDKFGFTCQDIFDWFTEKDFIITLCDGTDCGDQFQYFYKKMDRFFIHKKLLEDPYLRSVATKSTTTKPGRRGGK